MALAASGCDCATVLHKPRLLSDNGPSYVASELAAYIEAQSMSHLLSAPFHPQAQGKIERWHQTLKNRIPLENYYLPGDLEAQIKAFIQHYNHQRYHESLGNLAVNLDWMARSGPLTGLNIGAGLRHVDKVFADVFDQSLTGTAYQQCTHYPTR